MEHRLALVPVSRLEDCDATATSGDGGEEGLEGEEERIETPRGGVFSATAGTFVEESLGGVVDLCISGSSAFLGRSGDDSQSSGSSVVPAVDGGVPRPINRSLICATAAPGRDRCSRGLCGLVGGRTSAFDDPWPGCGVGFERAVDCVAILAFSLAMALLTDSNLRSNHATFRQSKMK